MLNRIRRFLENQLARITITIPSNASDRDLRTLENIAPSVKAQVRSQTSMETASATFISGHPILPRTSSISGDQLTTRCSHTQRMVETALRLASIGFLPGVTRDTAGIVDGYQDIEP